MIITKKVAGEVDLNNGEFAEVQTIGIDGIEKDLLLDTFQIHREDTDDTPHHGGFMGGRPIPACKATHLESGEGVSVRRIDSRFGRAASHE